MVPEGKSNSRNVAGQTVQLSNSDSHHSATHPTSNYILLHVINFHWGGAFSLRTIKCVNGHCPSTTRSTSWKIYRTTNQTRKPFSFSPWRKLPSSRTSLQSGVLFSKMWAVSFSLFGTKHKTRTTDISQHLADWWFSWRRELLQGVFSTNLPFHQWLSL